MINTKNFEKQKDRRSAQPESKQKHCEEDISGNQAAPVLYDHNPEYSRPALSISPDAYEEMLGRLTFLYGEEKARECMPELERILGVHYAHKSPALLHKEENFNSEERFTEKDIILISYGDLISGEEASPLATLARFCKTYLEGTINTLHLLPFFPYSSDRGFAVIDFRSVDPSLGTWNDIEELSKSYKLMFDGVFNHVSSQNRWFHEFLNNNPLYKEFFIAYDSPGGLTEEQRSAIVRPRTSDILTEFRGMDKTKYVWTTFSKDQVDLNYKNHKVLTRVIEMMLFYIRHGANIIRLDAVTYIWSEPGTRCASLDETHEVIKLFRTVLDIVAPSVSLVTETNVPHKENISYFGIGRDEAQMVYNFALPPLVLYTFYSENASSLSEWARGLAYYPQTSYFNFLDSHDGIGLMGVKNILDNEEIDFIIKKAQKHGGRISYKAGPEGQEIPYEINITWFSALNHDHNQDLAFQVKRFVASRIISLVLKGVPGIYLHSLIGTRNDIEAVLATNSNRDINRAVIDDKAFTDALMDPLSKVSRINRELGRLITIRTQKRAFHPYGGQKVLDIAREIFAVLRISPEGTEKILALTNISTKVCHLEIPLADISSDEHHWIDIVSGVEWMSDEGKLFINMNPYDIVWLEPISE
jgi:sucrose phosphorylase